GVNIADQFSRVCALCHTPSAQCERLETQQHDSESAGLENRWLHGRHSPCLLTPHCGSPGRKGLSSSAGTPAISSSRRSTSRVLATRTNFTPCSSSICLSFIPRDVL